ncbi:MAG TPA: pyridoxamine 5'-phosphate oxidase family protein [Iamia sp.]
MESKNLADLYDLPPVDWSTITTRLGGEVTQAPGTGGPNRHTWWLATLDADGRPHVTGIGGFWHEDALWFQTGLTTRKGRNLLRDPRCTASLAVEEFDLAVEGDAEQVDDPDRVARFVEECVAGGWPARVDDSGRAVTADFSAPSAGAPPWHVFRLVPRRAAALQTVEPGGATRWTF